MLQVALLKSEKALAAWKEWRPQIDFEGEFDFATFRLLPLAYENLNALGIKAPELMRFKGAYRKIWCETHQLFHETAGAVRALEQAQIDTMLLKGAPLVLRYYKNYATRAMYDLDILVRPECARDAIATLERAGWTRNASTHEEDLKYRHAMQFFNAAGRELDLHWHVFFECSQDGADDTLWHYSQPMDFNGIRTRSLDPTHLLLHVVVHGVRSNPEPPIRWIPDAMKVLQHAGHEIDWDRLISEAKNRRFVSRLRLGLRYLKERFDAPVPTDVLSRLASAPVTLTERIENTVILGDQEALYQSHSRNIWLIFADYQRFTAGQGFWPSLIGFTHYLRYRLGMEGRADLVKNAFQGLLRRLKRAVRTDDRHRRPASSK